MVYLCTRKHAIARPVESPTNNVCGASSLTLQVKESQDQITKLNTISALLKKAWKKIELETGVKLFLQGHHISSQYTYERLFSIIHETPTPFTGQSQNIDKFTEISIIALILKCFWGNAMVSEKVSRIFDQATLQKNAEILDLALVSPLNVNEKELEAHFDSLDCKINELKRIKEMDVSKTQVICALFGLNKKFEKYMCNLDKEISGHEPETYFIETLMESRFEESNDADVSFQFLGFTPSRAIFLEDPKYGYLENSESILYWAKSYIEQLSCTHPLLNKCDSQYLPNTIQTKHTEIRLSNNGDSTTTNGGNDIHLARFPNGYLDLTSYIVETQLGAPGSQLYFHGTTERHIDSILNRVELIEGKKKRDFSHGNGFYVSDNFETALKWAYKNGNGFNYAVLIYQVPNDFFFLNPGLDLSEKLLEWEMVVRHFRSGKKIAISDTALAHMVQTASFIKGPILANANVFPHRTGTPEFIKVDNHIRSIRVTQVCVKTDLIANLFTSFTKAVIFYHS